MDYIREIRGIIYTFARVMENKRYEGLDPKRRTKKENKHENEQNTRVIHETNEAKQQFTHHARYEYDNERKKKLATTHGVQKSVETSQL